MMLHFARFCFLFYIHTRMIFSDLQQSVKIRDFFMLIMHRSPEEESDPFSFRKDTLTPNRHTMPTE